MNGAMLGEALADLALDNLERGNLEIALGDGEKKPAASEINRRRNLRRGRYDAITGRPDDNGTDWLRPQHAPDDRAEF